MEMMGSDKFPLKAALVNVPIIWESLGKLALAVTVMFIILIIDPLLVKIKKMPWIE